MSLVLNYYKMSSVKGNWQLVRNSMTHHVWVLYFFFVVNRLQEEKWDEYLLKRLWYTVCWDFRGFKKYIYIYTVCVCACEIFMNDTLYNFNFFFHFLLEMGPWIEHVLCRTKFIWCSNTQLMRVYTEPYTEGKFFLP